MMSEAMQKLFDQEKRESVIIMLKKRMSMEDIMEILKVTKEYVYQVERENNLWAWYRGVYYDYDECRNAKII